MNDPFAAAGVRAMAADEAQAIRDEQAISGALEQRPGAIFAVGDYTPHHLRLHCLLLASEAPDGAPPPPLEEVMTRAERYWRFVISGLAKPRCSGDQTNST